jgi:acyl carrier protein
LDAERLPTVENLIRYIEAQQLSNPNIVARLMIRLEEEYSIAFAGDKWKLRQTNEIPVYLPRDSVENIPMATLNQIQELVTTRNIEKFERKSKFTPEIIEGALKSKHRVVIDDNYRVWFIDFNQ